MASTPGGTGTTTDALGEGEDEESSASSSIHQPTLGSLFDDGGRSLKDAEPNNELTKNLPELDRFRTQWRVELNQRHVGANSSTPSPSPQSRRASMDRGQSRSHLDGPISLYKQGIAFEQKGLMHEAVICYRQAIHMVPDIEQEFYRQQQKKTQVSEIAPVGQKLDNSVASADEMFDETWTSQDMVQWIESQLFSGDGEKVFSKMEKDQTTRHISHLPVEVLLNIFKWVVSSDLDLRQLEQLSIVCRGFYVLARQPELWKAACLRLWGRRVGNLQDNSLYSSWREMFLNRPHPFFHGLYISRITYIRHGESTFQDYNYRPWHMVVYYRYIRFFADGTVVMVTTPDEPQVVVPCLRTKGPQHSAALKGTYHFLDSECFGAILQRPKRNYNDNIMSYFNRRRSPAEQNNENEQIFHLEFRISGKKRRKQCFLHWLGYQIVVRYRSGQENRSQFVLTDQKFPTMIFSRVRSYLTSSESPL